MPLVGLLVMVIVFGVIVWAIFQLPIAEPFRTVAVVICVLILVLMLISYLPAAMGSGPWGHWSRYP